MDVLLVEEGTLCAASKDETALAQRACFQVNGPYTSSCDHPAKQMVLMVRWPPLLLLLDSAVSVYTVQAL